MLQKKQTVLLSLLGAALVVSIVILFVLPDRTRLTLDGLNQNVKVAEIKMGMMEEDVITLWGTGEYVHGFGGHGREYADYGVRISFPGDSDNDLYGRVGGLELQSSEHSVYGIKVGEDRQTAKEKLEKYGFSESDFSPDIFVQGEFMIGLHGDPAIEFIQIWFDDKDLKDRQY